MSLLNSTGERLRRATQLWHAYLAAIGQRFELAQFVQDPAAEEQILVKSLASGDAKLVGLAQEWLRDTGQPVPAVAPSRVAAGAAKSAAPQDEPPKPARYLRGVR
jgi:hypothetical protein